MFRALILFGVLSSSGCYYTNVYVDAVDGSDQDDVGASNATDDVNRETEDVETKDPPPMTDCPAKVKVGAPCNLAKDTECLSTTPGCIDFKTCKCRTGAFVCDRLFNEEYMAEHDYIFLESRCQQQKRDFTCSVESGEGCCRCEQSRWICGASPQCEGPNLLEYGEYCCTSSMFCKKGYCKSHGCWVLADLGPHIAMGICGGPIPCDESLCEGPFCEFGEAGCPPTARCSHDVCLPW